jgi:hypothetical protein
MKAHEEKTADNVIQENDQTGYQVRFRWGGCDATHSLNNEPSFFIVLLTGWQDFQSVKHFMTIIFSNTMAGI